jgi:hypothetical protein
MSPIPDDFEQLRRLLALKRHEQPPPGYFHGFSRQVIVRIQAGDLGASAQASVWSLSGGSFLQRIWATFDARPVLAGAFGVAVCGFFVVGALISDNTNATENKLPSPQPQIGLASPFEQSKAETEFSSLVPDYQPPKSSLFQEISARQARPSTELQSSLRATPQQVDYRVLSQP